MTVFEIKTNVSDYPFLVIADNFRKAIEQLQVNKICESEIVSVNRLETYNSDHILIQRRLTAKKEIEKEVRSELSQSMPHWKRMSNGAAGGGDRDIYLIRSSKGYYFTSSSIAGDDTFYIELESLENLPGLEKGE